MRGGLKITLGAACLLLAVSNLSYGQQGQVIFQNDTVTTPVLVENGSSSYRLYGPAGTYEIGLYVGPAGSTDISQLTLFDTTLNLAASSPTSVSAGLVYGGTIGGTANRYGNTGAFGGAGLVGGQTYAVEVAVWTTSDGSDVIQAEQSGDQNLLVGFSGIGSIVPSPIPAPPTQLFGSSAGQLPGVFIITPEPGTIALGGLGTAALLLFRRRK